MSLRSKVTTKIFTTVLFGLKRVLVVRGRSESTLEEEVGDEERGVGGWVEGEGWQVRGGSGLK